MKKYNIAIIGATGNVGKAVINILAERKFPINNIFAIASINSVGMQLSFGEKLLTVQAHDESVITQTDLAFFCTDNDISAKFIPQYTKEGVICIDKSSYYRMDSQVPLIIPEVNDNEIPNYLNKNIIASPNCCVIPLAMVLAPLHQKVKIKRIVVSTYQSVSGAGKEAIEELTAQTKSIINSNTAIDNKIFTKQIAFNVIPQIGNIHESGETVEEEKIIEEIEKIFHQEIVVSVTCVRVPVYIGHSLSVNIEFNDIMSANEAEKILQNQEFLNVNGLVSKERGTSYLTPTEVADKDFVHVSRIREDKTQQNTINLWICSDNLRKGAALNAVHIAENLIKLYEI